MMKKLLFIPLIPIIFLSSFSLMASQEYGMATYYNDDFQGKITANGEVYDKNQLTAAHKKYPFGSIIKVTNLKSKKSVRVRVNDRGPYVVGNIVDLSRKAAERIDLLEVGTTKVKVELISRGDGKTVDSKQSQKEKSSDSKTSKESPVKEYSGENVGLPDKVKESIAREENQKQKKKETAEKRNVIMPIKGKQPADKSTPKPTVASAAPEYDLVKGKDYQSYDLYKIQLLRPEKSGYGVQVASLKDYTNVLRQVADLQEKWFNNILISVEKDIDGLPIYKIILGPLPDKKSADAYNKDLKKKNVKGFVVDLSGLNY